MVLIVYFMEVIRKNARGAFVILLMHMVDEVINECIEHSAGVSTVDEALFKFFDTGVESW